MAASDNNERRLSHALAALADPTRRAVIGQLLQGSRRAGELAEAVSMSAPALSRHLRVLRQAGLIGEERDQSDARVRNYRIQAGALGPLSSWLRRTEALWEDQLQSFKAQVEAAASKRGSEL